MTRNPGNRQRGSRSGVIAIHIVVKSSDHIARLYHEATGFIFPGAQNSTEGLGAQQNASQEPQIVLSASSSAQRKGNVMSSKKARRDARRVAQLRVAGPPAAPAKVAPSKLTVVKPTEAKVGAKAEKMPPVSKPNPKDTGGPPAAKPAEPKALIKYLYRMVEIQPKPDAEVKTVREQKVPFACLAALDSHRISWSACHPKDQWVKKVARHKAVGRAKAATSLIGCIISAPDCIWAATSTKRMTVDGKTTNKIKAPHPDDQAMLARELIKFYNEVVALEKKRAENAQPIKKAA